MGASPQPILREKPQNMIISRPAILQSTPSSAKITLQKIRPRDIEDEGIIDEDEHDMVQTQASRRLNEEEYRMMEEN